MFWNEREEKNKRNEGEKKWTKGALGASYIAIFPMDLQIDY
jgi:hypothetical protein